VSYKFDSLMLILNRLDQREKVTIQSLAEELGICERTVYRYLDTIQAAGFPVHFDRQKRSYGFMEGYTLKKPVVSAEETLTLALSKKIMGRMGSGWEQSLDRIEEKLSVTKPKIPNPIFLPGAGLQAEVAGMIGTISEAIKNFQRLKLIYHPLYTDQKTKRKVDPYYLFFEDDFWYLRGYCHLRKEPRTFALDRIAGLKVLNDYFVPQNISPEDELSGSFGSVVDGKPVEVVLRFDPACRPYVQRKKWHQSQRERDLKDGRLELRFRVNGLEGISRWVYRWLPHVEVISPKELQERIVMDLQLTLKRYRNK
jgi:predicted DNA-binding transcriptional regulator YafY